MSARIKIDVRQIRGPFGDVVIKPTQQGHIVGVISFQGLKRRRVTGHAAKPQVLAGIWQLPTQPQDAASGIQLIASQIEVLSEDLKSVHRFDWRCRLETVIEKAGAGFFKVEGVAIVRDRYITSREELVKLLCQHPVVLRVFLVPWIVGKRTNRDLAIIQPFVGEG